eukprot:6406928-Prymnesium_polylepis.2
MAICRARPAAGALLDASRCFSMMSGQNQAVGRTRAIGPSVRREGSWCCLGGLRAYHRRVVHGPSRRRDPLAERWRVTTDRQHGIAQE